MKTEHEPVQVKIIRGKSAEVIRKKHFELVRSHIAEQIQNAPFTEKEIMAEIKAFRDGK